MKRTSEHGWFIAVIALGILSAAGCSTGGKIGVYKSESPIDISSMTPYKDRGLDIRLPPDWKLDPNVAPDSNNVRRARFFRDQYKGSTMTFLCFPTMTSIGKMAQALRDAVQNSMPDARLTAGTYEIEMPGHNPNFEVYSGSGTVEGRRVPLKFMIAWKLDSTIGACKYGVITAAPAGDSDVVMKDFIAVLHTLK